MIELASMVPNTVWGFVFFAFGIGVGSFMKRCKEPVEEISGEGILFDKIEEREKEAENVCKKLEEESAQEREQLLKKAKDEASVIVRKAHEEADDLRKVSEASIRNAFRDAVLVLHHLIGEKAGVLVKGKNATVKKALKSVSDELISTGKTISWKENIFELVPSKEGVTLTAEDVSLLALSLLEPGLRKNLPTPEGVATILQGKHDEQWKRDKEKTTG